MILDEIQLSDYDYSLPQDQIAQYPLKNRSEAKLLVYRNNTIQHHKFSELYSLVPEKSVFVFNNTKVIQARLIFAKDTGAHIEIFCLEPLSIKGEDPYFAQHKGEARWICLVGNKKKWKSGKLVLTKNLNKAELTLSARMLESNGLHHSIEFSWNTDHSFYEILGILGHTPIPPYIKRDDIPQDKSEYQTVYAEKEGAVAAPTAGLHFTVAMLNELEKLGFGRAGIALHVSAGTFKPISEKNVANHPMHNEYLFFEKKEIEKLLDTHPIVCVGTTSVRAIESLYWFGVMLTHKLGSTFFIPKLFPYGHYPVLPDKQKALRAVLDYMDSENLDYLTGNTEIFIVPGYKFRMCNALVTNFHMPKSTLILLVAAFIGNKWKELYEQALVNDYRFLSYGDACLFIP